MRTNHLVNMLIRSINHSIMYHSSNNYSTVIQDNHVLHGECISLKTIRNEVKRLLRLFIKCSKLLLIEPYPGMNSLNKWTIKFLTFLLTSAMDQYIVIRNNLSMCKICNCATKIYYKIKDELMWSFNQWKFGTNFTQPITSLKVDYPWIPSQDCN